MSEPVEVIKPFSESRANLYSRKFYLYRRKMVPPYSGRFIGTR